VALTGRGLKYGMPVLKIENCANSQVTLMVRTRASWDCMGILTIRDAHFPHIFDQPEPKLRKKVRRKRALESVICGETQNTIHREIDVLGLGGVLDIIIGVAAASP